MAWDDKVKSLAPGTIVWYGNPDKTVSHHQDTVNEVQRAATKLARDAQFVLSAHRYEGHTRIVLEHSPPRWLDSVVWMESPAESNSALAAVLSIEKGHWVFNRSTRSLQRVRGEDRRGRMRGIAPLGKAVEKSLRERKMK